MSGLFDDARDDAEEVSDLIAAVRADEERHGGLMSRATLEAANRLDAALARDSRIAHERRAQAQRGFVTTHSGRPVRVFALAFAMGADCGGHDRDGPETAMLRAEAAAAFDLGDIAHHLARLCRWNGAVRLEGIYSVATHSIAVSRHAEAVARLYGGDAETCRVAAAQGLLHDAAEAYVSDLASPVKAQLRDHAILDHRLTALIFRRFGLPALWLPEVSCADADLLALEAAAFMPFSAAERAAMGMVMHPETARLLEPPFRLSADHPGPAAAAFLRRAGDLGLTEKASTGTASTGGAPA